MVHLKGTCVGQPPTAGHLRTHTEAHNMHSYFHWPPGHNLTHHCAIKGRPLASGVFQTQDEL